MAPSAIKNINIASDANIALNKINFSNITN